MNTHSVSVRRKRYLRELHLVKVCPELPVTSLDVRVGEAPIHFSGSWQEKGGRHSLVQVTLTFLRSIKSLTCYLAEGILFSVII